MASNLIDPLTDVFPLSLLPPIFARQVQVEQYILVGTIGAFTWDLFNHVGDDYKLVTKHRIGLPTIVYFLSRITTICEVFGSTAFIVSPIKHCRAMQTFAMVCYFLCVPLTALLFFFRIRAIFASDFILVSCFFFLWLSVAAGAITPLLDIKAASIANTPYCIYSTLSYTVSVTIITSVVYDTSVFLAITWRLLVNSYVEKQPGIKGRFRGLVLGEDLPRFSRAIIQDGQIYYLVAISMNIVIIALLYMPLSSGTYFSSFIQMNAFVTNALACQVFRKTKFGIIRDDVIATGTTTNLTIRFALPGSLRSSNHNNRRGGGAAGRTAAGHAHPGIANAAGMTLDTLSLPGELSDSNMTDVVHSTVAMINSNPDMSIPATDGNQMLAEKTADIDSDYPNSGIEEFEEVNKAQYSV